MKRLGVLVLTLILVACGESITPVRFQIDSIENTYLSCESQELDGFRDYYDVILNKPIMNVKIRWYWKDQKNQKAIVYPQIVTSKYDSKDHAGLYYWKSAFLDEQNVYEINNEQYIVVPASGGTTLKINYNNLVELGDAIVAFKLKK